MKLWIAAWGLGLAFALAGCAQQSVPPPVEPAQPPPDEAEPEPGPPPETRIGVLVPLSGRAAALGEDMIEAAQMALFDVGPNEVILLPRDTGGTAAGARAAAEQVIAEGASLIIGPLFSDAVRAVTPVAQAAGVRVLAFSNVSAVADDGVWLLGFRPEEQVERVVGYTVGQDLQRIAGLAADDAYGRTAIEALQRAVIEAGGELGRTQFYPPDLADPSALIRGIAAYDERQQALAEERRRLEAEGDEAAGRALERLERLDTFGPLPFDAILIADGGDRLRSVASLLTFFDVDPAEVRFLGTMRWQDDPRVLEEPALQGGWFAAPAPDSMAAFERRFERIFGDPPQHLAALAYDATALAVIVVRDLEDPTFDPATLTDPEGFAGATGLFRLRPDGLTEHGLAILEVRGEATAAIDPAPASFVGGLAARGDAPPLSAR